MPQYPAPDPLNTDRSSESASENAPENSSYVREAMERERLHLAHDLHDELGSRLIAIKMALASLRQAPTDNRATLHAAVSHADTLLDQAIDVMHTVLRRLRPAELDLGLVAALQQIADDFHHGTLACTFSSNQQEIDAAPDLTLGVLRICREALANIGKHAHADTAAIRLDQYSDAEGAGSLQLDIVDDGLGMLSMQAFPVSIERRVLALGGTLERRPGAKTGPAGRPGCHLQIKLPMAPNPLVSS
jgi:signal transduction histidine kinase